MDITKILVYPILKITSLGCFKDVPQTSLSGFLLFWESLLSAQGDIRSHRDVAKTSRWVMFFVIPRISQITKTSFVHPNDNRNSKLISWDWNDGKPKDLGSNPSAVESVFFSAERFQILYRNSKVGILKTSLRRSNDVQFPKNAHHMKGFFNWNNIH